LINLCAENGPSVVFAEGEEIAINNPATGAARAYLFALDLHYYARANALAAAAAEDERAPRKVSLMTDILSKKLARGAELNSAFLDVLGIPANTLTTSGMRQDQFKQQVDNARSGGADIITCWLDAMATLSIWKSASEKPEGPAIYYAGNQQRLLLDAAGLTMVDKDELLIRNEDGQRDIVIVIRDIFDRVAEDPVAAAKAFALAEWVIHAYANTPSANIDQIARGLANAGGIHLMGETISINPRTHRPVSRKYAVLRVRNRYYSSHGSVEVFSSEVAEE
jgi:hypothetical protein